MKTILSALIFLAAAHAPVRADEPAAQTPPASDASLSPLARKYAAKHEDAERRRSEALQNADRAAADQARRRRLDDIRTQAIQNARP